MLTVAVVLLCCIYRTLDGFLAADNKEKKNLNKSSAFCISNSLMKKTLPPHHVSPPSSLTSSEAEHNLKSYFKTTITSNFKHDEIASVALEKRRGREGEGGRGEVGGVLVERMREKINSFSIFSGVAL